MDHDEALEQKIEDFHTLGYVWIGPELHHCIGLDDVHEAAASDHRILDWDHAIRTAVTFEQCQEYHRVFPELFERVKNELISVFCEKSIEWEGENRVD